MKRFLVKNPENKIYHILAYDEFEAIHKAKRLDSHIYASSQYKFKIYN
jgi:hypothetical protein